MTHISVWNTRTAKSYTYTDLGHAHALTLVDMVASGTQYLIADASSDIGPKIHPRIRTSWYTRDLPPEGDETMGLYESPHSPGCPPIKHRH